MKIIVCAIGGKKQTLITQNVDRHQIFYSHNDWETVKITAWNRASVHTARLSRLRLLRLCYKEVLYVQIIRLYL